MLNPRLASLLLLGAVSALPQGAGSAQDISAGARRDIAYTKSRITEPGGTPEDRLWQVLVLFGVGDREPSEWTGTLAVTSGDIHAVEGYRFELPEDRLLPQGGWRLKTKVDRVLYTSGLAGHGGIRTRDMLLPKGLLIRGEGSSATRVRIETNFGAFSFLPMAIVAGSTEKQVSGRVEIKRVVPATDLSGTPLRQHDFPAIAAGPGGALWIAWLSYHDRREELNFRRYKDAEWTRLIPVGRAAEDLWRPNVATDEHGKPWLIWSEQTRGNWDIYAMPWEDNEWGARHRLSTDPLPDIEPVAARAPDGTIYVAWQALRGRTSRIQLRYWKGGKWSDMVNVTESEFNDWEPAIAAGPDGRAWIAWDRYTTSYDVYCRAFSPSSGLSEERQVAADKRFEAHVSIAVDSQNRPWIAFESGPANWGKDLGAFLGSRAPGAPLGGPRSIEVVVLDNDLRKTPAKVAFRDSLAAGSVEEGVPLLYAAPDGGIWLAFKRRYARSAFRTSVHWESFLTRLDGDRWTDPIPLPKSWTRRSIRMGLAASGNRLWASWPHENRAWDFASRPLENRVLAGSLELPHQARAPVLGEYRPAPDDAPPVHPNEAADVAAARAYRVKLADRELRILRGDLHRHTELSQDQGGQDDGTIIEFYRYMIDAAAMDFGASTDHQAGGTDYWNTMTQKLADMYYFPQRFTPLYGYERNIANPHGHRNILHLTRDYPIVPFFQRIDPRFMLPDSPDGELLTFNSMSFGGAVENDTRLLYEALRKSGGLAISHTSSTNSMGTDWRDNDPDLEPVVEIYQGARQNAEHKNAPRGVMDGEEDKALGGFQAPGLVWNAWKKGYRLGVIASSDHYSTHISYAMVYAPGTSREEIFNAIRRRRTYGATDNIILEFWLGEHFMGDDFRAAEKQKIRVKAIGTGEIEKVRLIRDAQFIYEISPGKKQVDFEYLDTDAGPGEHWYYVRVEQANGELAWSSPIWVRY